MNYLHCFSCLLWNEEPFFVCGYCYNCLEVWRQFGNSENIAFNWKDRCSKAVAVWNQLSLLSNIICNMTKNIYYDFNKNRATRVYNRIEISFCISTVTSNYMFKKINMNNFHNEALVFKLIECVCAFEPTETDECKQCINNNVYQSSEVYCIYHDIYMYFFYWRTDWIWLFYLPISDDKTALKVSLIDFWNGIVDLNKYLMKSKWNKPTEI